MKILNPADGSLLRELAEDDAKSVAAKYARARAAQPAWAAIPLADRIDVIEEFKKLTAKRPQNPPVKV